jgi:hypothetical protein
MKHFPILIFLIPATVILGLAIFLGNVKERKIGLVILVVILFIIVRLLARHLIWQYTNPDPN